MTMKTSAARTISLTSLAIFSVSQPAQAASESALTSDFGLLLALAGTALAGLALLRTSSRPAKPQAIKIKHRDK
jgi:hypothetical protein